MLIALVSLAIFFFVLLVIRFAGVRRVMLLERWPSLVLGLAAVLALARGQVWFAVGLGAAAGLVWFLKPARAGARPPPDPEIEAARRILGVRAGASQAEIRAAYRAKMAQAHPDRGGDHQLAAALTAARDRLLRG